MDWEPDNIGSQSRVPAFPLAGASGVLGAGRECRGIRWALGVAGGLGAQSH